MAGHSIKSNQLSFSGIVVASPGQTYNTTLDNVLQPIANGPADKFVVRQTIELTSYVTFYVWLGQRADQGNWNSVDYNTGQQYYTREYWTNSTLWSRYRISVGTPLGKFWVGKYANIALTLNYVDTPLSPSDPTFLRSITATFNGQSTTAGYFNVLSYYGSTSNTYYSEEPLLVFMPDFTSGSTISFPGSSNTGITLGSASASADFTTTKALAGYTLGGISSNSADLSTTIIGGKRLNNPAQLSFSADLSVINGFRVPGSAQLSTGNINLTASAKINPGGYAPSISADSTATATAGMLIQAQFGQRYTEEDYIVPDYFYPDANPPSADLSLAAVGNVNYVLTTATEELTLFDIDISLTADVTQLRPGQSSIDCDITLACDAQVAIAATQELTYDSTQDSVAANLIDFGTTGYTDDDYVDPEYFEGFNIRIVLASEFTTEVVAATEVITSSEMFWESSLQVDAGFLLHNDAILDATAAFDTLGGNGPGVIINSVQALIDAQADLAEAVENLISAEANLQAFNDITLIVGRIQLASAVLDATFTTDITTDFRLGIELAVSVDSTVTSLVGYGLYASATLDASNIMLTTGKIVALDDYYIVVVPPETRIINTSNEPRYLLVKPETRITTTPLENRDILVNPETRTYKITANKAIQIGRRTRRIEQ